MNSESQSEITENASSETKEAVPETDLATLIEDCRSSKSVSLNLSQRSLRSLPSRIGTLISLERLGLSNNCINILPLEFIHLTHLRYLNLRSNHFREFPVMTCKLPLLEILDLSRNKIRKLPKDLGCLMNLKVLSLARNRLTSLPTYISQMDNLKVLKIENNPIQWPPREIWSCDKPEETPMWLPTLKTYLNENANVGNIPLPMQENDSTMDDFVPPSVTSAMTTPIAPMARPEHKELNLLPSLIALYRFIQVIGTRLWKEGSSDSTTKQISNTLEENIAVCNTMLEGRSAPPVTEPALAVKAQYSPHQMDKRIIIRCVKDAKMFIIALQTHSKELRKLYTLSEWRSLLVNWYKCTTDLYHSIGDFVDNGGLASASKPEDDIVRVCGFDRETIDAAKAAVAATSSLVNLVDIERRRKGTNIEDDQTPADFLRSLETVNERTSTFSQCILDRPQSDGVIREEAALFIKSIAQMSAIGKHHATRLDRQIVQGLHRVVRDSKPLAAALSTSSNSEIAGGSGFRN